MSLPEARTLIRGATFTLWVIMVTSLCPPQASSDKTNPIPCPEEAVSSVPDVNPDALYPKVDYLLPVSSVRTPTLYIYKNKRRLLVLEKDVLVRNYRIGLGPSPLGDKERSGDGRTPEGEFFVCAKNPSSKYHKSLELNYPGEKHATQALLSGQLSYGEYETILKTHTQNQRPPYATSLGGRICIHGGGAHEDWTKGCIALYNFDMDELFEMVTIGTPVFILP